MNWQPLVTVVTPSYRYARYLGRCLTSVRSQTYPRVEHVVIDALSNDGSAEVIASYDRTYELRAFFERDAGQADGLNKGFDRARGDVLCWLNADDFYLHENVIAQAVQVLARGIDVVTGGGRIVDEQDDDRGDIAPNHGQPLSSLRYASTLFQPATFWRRQVHLPLRTDLHYAFDWRFFLDVMHRGASFEVADQRWAALRMHGINKTAQDPPNRRREIARVLREEWGVASPQFLWSAFVYAGYVASERIESPLLRRAIGAANERVRMITRGRIYSC